MVRLNGFWGDRAGGDRFIHLAAVQSVTNANDHELQ